MNSDSVPSDFDRLERLFHDLVDLSAPKRAQRLAEIKQQDGEMYRELCELLADETTFTGFDRLAGDARQAVEQPKSVRRESDSDTQPLSAAARPSSLFGASPPPKIGPYTIREQIGSGGMGAVFRADREQPYSQTVAVKLLKRCADTEDIVARFALERQILATLDHPGICRVIDGGTTDDGRPYFVMEYVDDGKPITDFANASETSIEERVGLFLAACEAVQHAHDRLVIHRDLKPSNILISAGGTVKLLDFGIAKIMDPASPTSLATRAGALPMTPEYASPEQLRSEPLAVTSDVYSLGVVLYELLAGCRPYEAETLGALLDSVGKAEPPKPSTRLAQRRREPTALGVAKPPQHAIPTDLDRIALKALRLEPEARYLSARALAADLERWLDRRPVSARPPTLSYRARRFVQRNPIGAAASIAAALALVAGASTTTWQGKLAKEQRDRAQLEASKATQISDLLIDVFNVSDPLHRPDAATMTVQQFTENAESELLAELESQPEVQAKLRTTLAGIEINIARYDKARELLEKSLEQQRALFPGEHPDIAATLLALSKVARFQGRYEETEALARQALINVGDAELLEAKVLISLGTADLSALRFDSAAVNYERAIAIRRRVLGARHPDTASAIGEKAIVHYSIGEFEQAIAQLREVIDILLESLGDAHHAVIHERNNLGAVLAANGQFEEAFSEHQRTLTARRQLLGDNHPFVAFSLAHLGSLATYFGRFDEADDYLRRAFDLRFATYGNEHHLTAISQAAHAGLLCLRGRLDPARSKATAALETQERLFGPEHTGLVRPLEILADIKRRSGDDPGALAYLKRSSSISRKGHDELHPGRAPTLLALAAVQIVLNDFDSARESLLVADRIIKQRPQVYHPERATLALHRGDLAHAQGQLDEAKQYYRDAAKHWKELLDTKHWRVAEAEGRLGAVLTQTGDAVQGSKLLREGLIVLEASLGTTHPSTALMRAALKRKAP